MEEQLLVLHSVEEVALLHSTMHRVHCLDHHRRGEGAVRRVYVFLDAIERGGIE